MQKIKRFFTHEIKYKLISLGLAFGLWLLVVNYDDPVMSYTYSGINVEIINGESLTNVNKVYEVMDGTDVISVTLKGKRSVVESIAKENIKAVADINKMTIMNTVEIEVVTNKNYAQLDSIKSDTASVALTIENLKEIHLPINVNVNGKPMEGFVVGDIMTNQNTVRVSGPESIVDTIVTAECNINVDGRVSDITTSADIELFDDNGAQIEANNISTNIRSINVSAAVLATKAVDIKYNYSGVPAEGYVVYGELSSDRMAMYIAGKQAVLDGVSEIVVPASAIKVDDLDQSYTAIVELDKYLPEGTRFADSNFDGQVGVLVNIEKTVTKTLNVPMRNLSFINVPEDLEAQMFISSENISEEDSEDVLVKIQVSGVEELLSGLTGQDITGVIDINSYMNSVDRQQLKRGVYQMDIIFDLPENVEAVTVYHADVSLEEKE